MRMVGPRTALVVEMGAMEQMMAEALSASAAGVEAITYKKDCKQSPQGNGEDGKKSPATNWENRKKRPSMAKSGSSVPSANSRVALESGQGHTAS